MKKPTRQTVRYLSAYTACTVAAYLLLNLPFLHEPELGGNVWLFLSMFIIGIAASKGGTRTRNLTLLFQMPTLLHAIFMAAFFFCPHLEYAHFVTISAALYCVFFILWHTFSPPDITVWHILGVTYPSMLILLFVPDVCSGTGWDDFLLNSGGTLSTYAVYALCLLPAAVFCQVQDNILKWGVAFCVLCSTLFFGGFYLDPLLYHKFQYGTFTGTLEKNTSARHT